MKYILTIILTICILMGLSFAQWNTQTVDNSGDVGKWSDIAYDSQGYPHIVYFDDTGNDVMYAYWNGTAWMIEQIRSLSFSGFVSCAIAVDNQDYPHVVLDNSSTEYWNKVSGNWQEIDQTSVSGDYPDICLYYNQSTGQTIPHISFYRTGSYQDLYHAYLDPNTNQLVEEIVDQASDVGIWSHIICDDNENLYISYYDQGSGALKFANYNGTQWSTAIIDDVGDVGRYNSIALDASGNPCISYYDETNGDLKYVVINDVSTKK